MKKFIIKYVPDVTVLIGIWIYFWILSYTLLLPERITIKLYDNTGYKVLGIMLIAVGIDMLIRKYFLYKKQQKLNN